MMRTFAAVLAAFAFVSFGAFAQGSTNPDINQPGGGAKSGTSLDQPGGGAKSGTKASKKKSKKAKKASKKAATGSDTTTK
jgi:hypothetical protein